MIGAVTPQAFDRAAIEAHVSLLHDLAEGLDGILILAAFEEGGLPNVQRFGIGDVTKMVETIMGFECHPRVNLYIPWAVMRRDLEPRKKGTEEDVIAVLAAVPDLDNDKHKIGSLPVEAPYVVESSPGNFQPVYIFERPLPPGEAKPVLTAISDFIGGDSGTKDCSHVWRIPGTLNIPTKSKLARGRSHVPAPVTIKKTFDGRFISPAALLALAPPPRRPNGHDTAPSGPLSFAEEARLRGALKVIPAEDRDTWLKVGAALHLVGARAVWADWSKTSTKFDAADQDRVWASFHGARKEGVVTIATIYALAKERGWVSSVNANEPFLNGQAKGEGATPRISRVIGAGTFMRSYEAISYTIDGVLPSGCLYGLTAKPGSGKTAWMITATLAVETGREDILGCAVERGRVAYVTIENPVDFKMKLAANCYLHNISYDEIEPRVAIIDGRDTPEQIYEGLKLDAEANGPFQLVCFDTFQAGFAVANAGAFNDNEAVLKYVQRLRPLTALPGLPSVLVAFHPTKNALEAELIPYGGGATYGEIDGNLRFGKTPRSSSTGTAFADPSSSHGFSGSKNLAAPILWTSKAGKFCCPSFGLVPKSMSRKKRPRKAAHSSRC